MARRLRKEKAGKPVLPDAPENMQFSGRRPANPEYKVIDENGNLTEYGKWYYKRPSGFRKGIRKQTYDTAQKASNDNIVRDPDPNNPVEIKYTDEWDMGHKPGHEFWKHQKDAAKREIGRSEFLDEYKNPENYRPETPHTNRSHKLEDKTDVFQK